MIGMHRSFHTIEQLSLCLRFQGDNYVTGGRKTLQGRDALEEARLAKVRGRTYQRKLLNLLNDMLFNLLLSSSTIYVPPLFPL